MAIPPVERRGYRFVQTQYISLSFLAAFSDFVHLKQFIQPHDITYKARTEGPRLKRQARAILGPSRKSAEKTDPFFMLNVDPAEYSFDSTILSHFVSDMGKIHPRSITRLTTKNQRRIAKAIRRAKVMGIMPTFSRRDILEFDNLRAKQARADGMPNY
jgi:ribosomal protein S18